ncbi:hypothetical protein DV738_g2691, partial [Chaetothyriales sp. CBS 135597]
MSYWTLADLISYLRMPFLAGWGLTALGSTLLYFRQNDLIYPANVPAGSRTQVPEPTQFGIRNADSVNLQTPDGETLHAYLLRPANSSISKNCTIITFHGNAGNVGHRLPIGKILADTLGCYCFMAEYRGYGLSTGSPSEEGLAIDGQTVLDYVRNHEELKNTRIIVYGQSLGGALTVKLVQANQHVGDIAGVILENTFTSIRKLIPSVMPVAKWISVLCHQTWKSDETLAKMTKTDIPFLFLSGLKDEIVPPEMMRTLHSICPCRKSWHEFPNGHHNDTVAEPGYFDAIWAFLIHE